MLRSTFDNLFEKAFLWAKNWFNNWVKTNSERTIIEIGQEGTQFLRNIFIGTYLLIIFLGIIGFNIYSLPIPIIRLILAIPVIWIIKEIQFNFIKVSKTALEAIGWIIKFISVLEIFLAFSDPESREMIIHNLTNLPPDLIESLYDLKIYLIYFFPGSIETIYFTEALLDLSEPTIFNCCLFYATIPLVYVIFVYLFLCVLGIIRFFISWLEAATIKMIAMILAGRKDIIPGIMLVIILVATGKIGHYLLQRIGLP